MTPPVPIGSTANRAAASAASAQGDGAASSMRSCPEQLPERALDARGRAGLVERIARAADGAAQRARRDAGANRSTAVSPSSAASARAARISVSSPRRPSVPSRMHSCAARSSAASGTAHVGAGASRAETMRGAAAPRPSSTSRRRRAGRARTRRAGARPRCASRGPSGVFTSTERPKRSSSCGRSSPSSGLPLPIRTKRAGWRTLRPSRSTTFSPEAATPAARPSGIAQQQSPVCCCDACGRGEPGPPGGIQESLRVAARCKYARCERTWKPI